MLAVSIVLASFLFILFLVVGVIGGWVARDYMMNYQEVEKIHPEMYDRNGNIVPDEIVAFRFENYDNNSCLLYTSPSPRDGCRSRMPSSA